MATVTIQAGDDYTEAGQGALTWTSLAWPSLTGAAIVLVIVRGDATVMTVTEVIRAAPTLVEPPVPQSVEVSLSDARSTLLTLRAYTYLLRATLAGGDIVTLEEGDLIALPEPTGTGIVRVSGEILTGTGAPVAVQLVGTLYLDLATGNLYRFDA